MEKYQEGIKMKKTKEFILENKQYPRHEVMNLCIDIMEFVSNPKYISIIRSTDKKTTISITRI